MEAFAVAVATIRALATSTFLFSRAFLRATFRSAAAFLRACSLFAAAALILFCAFFSFFSAATFSAAVSANAFSLVAFSAAATAFLLSFAAFSSAFSFSSLILFNSFCIEAFATAVADIPAATLAASLLDKRALLTMLFIMSFGFLPFFIPALYSFIRDVLFDTPIFVNNEFNLTLFLDLESRSRRANSRFFEFISDLAALYLASDNAAFFLFAFEARTACASFAFKSFVASATTCFVLFVRVVTSFVNFSILALASFNSLVSFSTSSSFPSLVFVSKRNCKSVIVVFNISRSFSISLIRCSLFSIFDFATSKSD